MGAAVLGVGGDVADIHHIDVLAVEQSAADIEVPVVEAQADRWEARRTAVGALL